MAPHGLYNNILYMLTGENLQPVRQKNVQISYQLSLFISQSQHKTNSAPMAAPGEIAKASREYNPTDLFLVNLQLLMGQVALQKTVTRDI